MRTIRGWIVLTCLVSWRPATAVPRTGMRKRRSPPRASASLRPWRLPDAKITTASLVPAGGFVPPPAPPPGVTAQPAFAGVPAFAASRPRRADAGLRDREVWMPTEAWNGKLVGTGNGGFSGAIGYNVLAPLVTRGYAAAATNTGHDGGPADTAFAVGHPEKLADFGWRAVHEMTVKAKAIVAAHYGAAASRSYWSGCSTGGRQGLKEAQVFPEDYDAIAAGAPASNWVPLVAYGALVQQTNVDANAALSREKLVLLKEAAIKQCDARDGVTDRVINEPKTCAFDPTKLQCQAGEGADCLTARQVESARKIYRGVVNPRTGTTLFSGPQPGSEPAWAGYQPGVFPIAANYWRDIVMKDPNWDLKTLDFDADLKRAYETETFGLAATEPNLARFVAHGGKLLLWHGMTDGLIPTQSSIDYYNDVIAANGADKVKDAVRLFLLPGVDHCRGGEGTYAFDDVAALDAWVEQNRAPDTLTASRPLDGGAQRTRPLCPYPQVARYKGSGNSDDAASFECAAASSR